MNNPKYLAIIQAGAETRNIDFKGPMNWHDSKCTQFELLKDIAAMANTLGGGHIVVGREKPTHTSGTLTQDQVKSFDPTEVNKFVHKYLAPTLECRVELERIGQDELIVIEVPEFDTMPLVFQIDGHCGSDKCKKEHFRRADLFIRTKAQQSQRVATVEQMHDIIASGMRKSSAALVADIQRMLSSPQAVEEPMVSSPYDAEYEDEERDFFGPTFYPRVPFAGHFDMSVKPVEYRNDRIDLRQTPRKVAEFAYVLSRNGIIDAVPFDLDHTRQNFVKGARLRLVKPEWRRIEAVSLHTSGLYRVVRCFLEDYQPDAERKRGTFIETDRTLMVDLFVEQMTMLHLLARNIARELLADADEEVQVDLRVDGLAGRTLSANQMDPLQQFLNGLHGQQGTKNIFLFPLRTTRRALELDAVKTARDQCEQILWTFGMSAPNVVQTVQRKLLWRTPDATML